MATVTYRIKGTTQQPGIKIRFKQGDEFDFELSTGLKTQRKHWSQAKQKVKLMFGSFDYADDVNFKLLELKIFVLERYYKDLTKGVSISQKWLRNAVDSFLNKPSKTVNDWKVFFLSFIDLFIKEIENKTNNKTGKPITKRTLQSYLTCKHKLIEFEKEEGIRLKIEDINLDFHNRFENYLRTVHLLNPNTIGGYFDNVKLFCRNAELKGLKVNVEFKNRAFYSPQNNTSDIYLDNNEINLLFNYDFSFSKRLENARDWLIVGVWTGLRVSDLLKLNNSFVKDGMINITTRKTNTQVIIPLHPQVIKIIKRRGGDFPFKISDQKFNDYIKEVCKTVGVTQKIKGAKMVPIKDGVKTIHRKQFGEYSKYELVSSHICRRSFATNLYGKLDTLSIMKITGHQTESQFLEYIKTTSSEHAEKLRDLWGTL